MVVSTPLLERRRKISSILIILVRQGLFSELPYIRSRARRSLVMIPSLGYNRQ
jgi:hypothetical protein